MVKTQCIHHYGNNDPMRYSTINYGWKRNLYTISA